MTVYTVAVVRQLDLAVVQGDWSDPTVVYIHMVPDYIEAMEAAHLDRTD